MYGKRTFSSILYILPAAEVSCSFLLKTLNEIFTIEEKVVYQEVFIGVLIFNFCKLQIFIYYGGDPLCPHS